jgi:hypothetical protein
MERGNVDFTRGVLPSSIASCPIKPKNEVSKWSKWTPGTRVKPVLGVGINIARTVVLKVSSFAALVATASMLI